MPLDLYTRIKAVREAGYVQRGHLLGVTHYSLAQHQYGVAMLCLLLWGDKDLAAVALVHDVPERWTGDIPSTFIRTTPGLSDMLTAKEMMISAALDLPSEHSLLPEQFARLKGADSLELFLWCLEESNRGSTNVSRFMENILKSWEKNPPPEPVLEIADKAQARWSERLPEVFEEVLLDDGK